MFREQFAQCPATAPQLTEGVEYFSLGHRLAVTQMPHFVCNLCSRQRFFVLRSVLRCKQIFDGLVWSLSTM